MYKALIIGGTGLIGQELISQLLEKEEYSQVVSFVRKPSGIVHDKLVEEVIDFKEEATFESKVKGDHLFCCLGTTIKTAGSKEKFEMVDYEYPLKFARIGKKNGVEKYLLVSALGATTDTSNFYLKTKGRVEEDIKEINFSSFVVFRPSLLLGDRAEFRFGEKVGEILLTILSPIMIGPLRQYRGNKVKVIAKIMIEKAIQNENGFTIMSSNDLR